ncbi:AGAP005963-PB [Anopheles gambiae str. PEST]|uniref:BCL2-associated athanogene 6 n=1 Tax=Anopheles gambiae TaxID=7165 RepID=Q7PIK1_ANOGA|nr:AGAP005963-PB [Anopheles gambiae str. PEST]
MINLKVKTLDSQNHDFTVDEEISVRQFKEQIADKISVSVELQRLIYCGRVLSDDVPLKNYDLNGKVVHLVQRPPPSARGTSLSTSESGGRDEGARASRRSRSSDNASRTIFPSLDELNTMYFGSMTSIPLNMTSTNVTQIPSVGSSSTLCNNRITVARHMLDCADSILSYLENPARGLNYSAMDYLSQQTMESTVFEVGISAVGDVDIPHNQVQSFVNAFQGAVSAALRQNGMSNVTVQQPDGLNGSVQVFGTVPDFAVLTPPNTSATATPAHEGSETSAESRRQARSGLNAQTTSTQTLGEVVQQMRSVQRRMEPFLQQYYDILQDDPAFDESDTVGRENAQRVFDRVSEAMHYISHAQHAISDLMLDLQMTTPRHLCCRPILVEQNAYVSSGMAAMPQNINLANLLRNHINVNNNNNNNNNPEVGNNNIHAQLINLGITAQPTFFAAAGGGTAPGATAGATATANNTMRPPSSAPSGGGTTAAPSTTAPNGAAAAAAANNTTAQPRPPNLGQSQSRPPMAAVGGGVSGVGGGGGGGVRGSDNMVTSVFIPLYDLNSVRRLEHVLQAQPVPNAQIQMARLIQAVVNAAPIHTDIHVQINTAGGGGGGGGGAGGNTGSGAATAPPPTNNAGSRGGSTAGATAAAAATSTTAQTTNTGSSGSTAGENVVHVYPRFATVTLPTTSTQTRSTSRPHVHSIPPSHLGGAGQIRNLRPMAASILNTFDRFLPCNSHHIRDNTGSNGDRSSEGTPNRTGSGETTANTPNAAPPSTEGGSDTVPMQDDVRTAAAATRVNMFGTQLTMGDLQNLVPNPNTLNRIREPLRSYVNRALFTPDREVDEQTVREAGERIINNVMPMLVPVVDIESPEFDTRASLANLMRSTFPSFINLVREDSSSQFGVRLMRLLLTFLRRSFMILIRGVGRERSLMAVSTLVAFALRLHNVPEPERLVRLLIRPTLENNFAAAARHDMFDIQQFLVIRQPAPESAAATGAAATGAAAAAAAPGTATTADGSESLSSSSMSSSTGTSSGQREASPMDVDEAETMSTPELVSDIAEISISIEPPAMSVDPADSVPTSSSPDAGPAASNDGELAGRGDRTPQPAEAPAQEVPIVTCSLTGTDLDFANRPVPPPRPPGDDEELPTVEYDAESWHRHFPSNWLPIITRDLGRQRRQSPQAPFSDAYISGLSSKRRKLLSETKPASDVHSLISDGVRRAFLGTGIAPSSAVIGASTTAAAATSSGASGGSGTVGASTSAAGGTTGGGGSGGGSSAAPTRFRTLDELANNIANDGALQMSYCEAMKASIRDRLAKDTDYDAMRFPNCSKYFEK